MKEVPDPKAKNKPRFDHQSYEGRYYAPDEDIPLDDDEAEAFLRSVHLQAYTLMYSTDLKTQVRFHQENPKLLNLYLNLLFLLNFFFSLLFPL